MEWQLLPVSPLPPWMVQLVKSYLKDDQASGEFAAQLLWQRGIRDRTQAQCFLDHNYYTATSASAFGEEMVWAVDRLEQAWHQGEKIAIWGDFDADGITATAVLWEGLGQWFPQNDRLQFWIPDRLKESHGLSRRGLETLAAQGVKLIVTCDTGCTNVAELAYAQTLGLAVIVTDHHTLMAERPPVVALINPRSLPGDHPLATLSGVAVAYKLLEALTDRLPPRFPLENLLDLVVIGLVADLVELKGDCRHLAQRGFEVLKTLQDNPQRRPGVAELLKLCKNNGDRPSDIAFGLAPRINAVSRVVGDPAMVVELLTSRDRPRCRTLAEQVELLNARRKGLQQSILEDVKRKLAHQDWSTSPALILAEVGWPVGLLGLVAGQLMQEYQRPVILLSIDEALDLNPEAEARGSGRSLGEIHLYDLLESQRHLLTGFGGHPLAAGLSLPARNLPLFEQGIYQVLANRHFSPQSILRADLQVTLGDLNMELFRELRLLDPYGMGNPEPLLLIRQVQFRQVSHRKLRDRHNTKISYFCTHFFLTDGTCQNPVPGVWWGHTQDEIPLGDCDVMVELGYNVSQQNYEVRLKDLRPTAIVPTVSLSLQPRILDYRSLESPRIPAAAMPLTACPQRWQDLSQAFETAHRHNRPLALCYGDPPRISAFQQVKHWLRLAKQGVVSQAPIPRSVIQGQLGFSDRVLDIALWSLESFAVKGSIVPGDRPDDPDLHFVQEATPTTYPESPRQRLQVLLEAIEEAQFRQGYFSQVPGDLLEQLLSAN